ncbi:hypothetical protein [Desulfonatronum sp. SC1]|uniref:hypothetical protein n=1 Tax=Desulfonatronum sp. SC1 TaxID=2109626 RepID=UPI000D308AD3|nr:hypothetical protein [Desulfonatronum sp. SC1]PTN39056.1 hypothetical protein C6366_01065 [Desulfonatronum sp. SC1]
MSTDPEGSRRAAYFWAKIFVVTIAILLCTLVLNSILSISSFERTYTTSLVATMENAGANLVQRIERGIRLGKPLGAFEGMNDLLADFLASKPALSGVAVADDRGEVLYFTSGDPAFRELFVLHGRDHPPKAGTFTVLHHPDYVSAVPVIHGERIAGAVLISFSRQNVHDRVRDMAVGALVRLGWALLGTSVVLVVLLALFVIRPIQKDLERISASLGPFLAPGATSLESGGRLGSAMSGDSRTTVGVGDRYGPNLLPGGQLPDFRKIRNDIVRIGAYLQGVAWHVRDAGERVGVVRRELGELRPLWGELEESGWVLEAHLATIGADPDLGPRFGDELRMLIREQRRLLLLLETFFAESGRGSGP